MINELKDINTKENEINDNNNFLLLNSNNSQNNSSDKNINNTNNIKDIKNAESTAESTNNAEINNNIYTKTSRKEFAFKVIRSVPSSKAITNSNLSNSRISILNISNIKTISNNSISNMSNTDNNLNKKRPLILENVKNDNNNNNNKFNSSIKLNNQSKECLPNASSSKLVKSEKESLFNTGRWLKEEHKRFVHAILKHGNEWKLVQKYVVTRSSTQARSHAQKFFLKIKRSNFLEKYNLNKSISIQNLLKLTSSLPPNEYDEVLTTLYEVPFEKGKYDEEDIFSNEKAVNIKNQKKERRESSLNSFSEKDTHADIITDDKNAIKTSNSIRKKNEGTINLINLNSNTKDNIKHKNKNIKLSEMFHNRNIIENNQTTVIRKESKISKLDISNLIKKNKIKSLDYNNIINNNPHLAFNNSEYTSKTNSNNYLNKQVYENFKSAASNCSLYSGALLDTNIQKGRSTDIFNVPNNNNLYMSLIKNKDITGKLKLDKDEKNNIKSNLNQLNKNNTLKFKGINEQKNKNKKNNLNNVNNDNNKISNNNNNNNNNNQQMNVNIYNVQSIKYCPSLFNNVYNDMLINKVFGNKKNQTNTNNIDDNNFNNSNASFILNNQKSFNKSNIDPKTIIKNKNNLNINNSLKLDSDKIYRLDQYDKYNDNNNNNNNNNNNYYYSTNMNNSNNNFLNYNSIFNFSDTDQNINYSSNLNNIRCSSHNIFKLSSEPKINIPNKDNNINNLTDTLFLNNNFLENKFSSNNNIANIFSYPRRLNSSVFNNTSSKNLTNLLSSNNLTGIYSTNKNSNNHLKTYGNLTKDIIKRNSSKYLNNLLCDKIPLNSTNYKNDNDNIEMNNYLQKESDYDNVCLSNYNNTKTGNEDLFNKNFCSSQFSCQDSSEDSDLEINKQ